MLCEPKPQLIVDFSERSTTMAAIRATNGQFEVVWVQVKLSRGIRMHRRNKTAACAETLYDI